MSKIAVSKGENDFNSIVGADRYSYLWFVAAFRSLRSAQLHAFALSIDEFHIETKDHKQQLGAVVITTICRLDWVVLLLITTIFSIRSIVSELGNYELDRLLVEGLQRDLTVSNVLERIRDSESFGFGIGKLIAFAA
jgi:hypothetical protein